MTPAFDRSFVVTTVGRLLLPLWFTASCALVFWNFATHGFLFLDLVVYREAAVQVLTGSDPWAVSGGGASLAFAAPPPTIVGYLPLALLPEPVAIAAGTALLAVAAWWSVRRLGLPMWWVLFPPVFESVIVGNPDVLVLALLLARGRVAGLAAVLKVYAFIPLLAQRRWGAAALAVGLSALSIPLWPSFFSNLLAILATLDEQSSGFSAWGTWLLLPTLIALWGLRRRGAEWLVVPGVWPNTQMHYAAMSLVVVRRFPLAAALLATQLPWAAPVAVMAIAIEVWFRDRPAAAPRMAIWRGQVPP